MTPHNPFKFLDSFTKEDKDIFFGREMEVEEIYSRVFQSKLLLVYGASGTGKTSLIQCGLANKFNDADWLPILIRRAGNMLESMHFQLSNLALTPLKSAATLKKSIQSLYLDHFKPIYLIFDQFEELFIFGSPQEIQAFVSEVGKIVKSELQCKFIFIIRGEYLEYLSVFEEELPDLFNNRIRIEKMTRQKAVETILGPCKQSGIKVDENFATNLLDKLSSGKTEIELTYLQVFLDKLYKRAETKNDREIHFTNSLLDELGNVSDILSTFLEEQVAKMPDSETALLVLKSFVSSEGTRKPMSCSEIDGFAKSFGKDLSAEKVKSFVNQFVDLRILKDKDENNRYELRHDALASRIFEKITIVEKDLIDVRMLIENAYANFLKRKVLINENDLAYIAPYQQKLYLKEELSQFVEESRRHLTGRKRRTRNLLAALAGLLFVILSGFTIWAMLERSVALSKTEEAEKQKNFAEQEKQIAEQKKNEVMQANSQAMTAKAQAEENARTAMQAKTQAENSRQEAMQSMHIAEQEKANAMQQSRLAKEQAANAETQKQIATREKQNAVESEQKVQKSLFLSIAQGVALRSVLYKNDPQLEGLLALQAFKLNKDNGGIQQDPVIFDALRSSCASLNEGQHSIVASPFAPDNLRSPVDKQFFSSDGHYLATSLEDYTILLWDLQKGKSALPEKLDGHKGLVRGLAFSPDLSHLASAGKDSILLFWNISSNLPAIEKTWKSAAAIKSVLFCPDGKNIYILDEKGTIVTGELNTGIYQPILYKSNSKAQSFALNPKTNTLILGLGNGNLLFKNFSASTETEIKAHISGVEFIIFNADYSMMASAGADKTIKIFDAQNPETSPITIKDIHSKVRTILFTSENKLVIGCADKNTYFIETSTESMAKGISGLLKRNMTKEEWKRFFKNLPYEKTSANLPDPD